MPGGRLGLDLADATWANVQGVRVPAGRVDGPGQTLSCLGRVRGMTAYATGSTSNVLELVSDGTCFPISFLLFYPLVWGGLFGLVLGHGQRLTGARNLALVNKMPNWG